MVAIGEEVRQRDVHGGSDFGERVERGDGVAVLYARQIAAQQPSTFFDIALRHALLQAIIADRLTNVHCGFSLGQRSGVRADSNQSRTFLQAEFLTER